MQFLLSGKGKLLCDILVFLSLGKNHSMLWYVPIFFPLFSLLLSGDYLRSTIGLSKGDKESLDYSSFYFIISQRPAAEDGLSIPP